MYMIATGVRVYFLLPFRERHLEARDLVVVQRSIAIALADGCVLDFRLPFASPTALTNSRQHKFSRSPHALTRVPFRGEPSKDWRRNFSRRFETTAKSPGAPCLRAGLSSSRQQS